MQYDLIILGGGIAGLTAAIYGTRANFSTLVIEKNICGGQIISAPDVVNYPGIKEVSGAKLATELEAQALELGAKISFEQIQNMDLTAKNKIIETNQESYQANGVIIAVGARHRKLGCKGESEFEGKGVSYCANCDGNFFKEKTVCVVGGGNTALEEALYLSKICKQVYLIHRRLQFRGSRRTAEIASQTPNISFKLECEVEDILGDRKVTGVRLKNVNDSSVEEQRVDGVFISVGMQPETEQFSPYINLDSSGYIKAGQDCRTNIPFVYAAGDVREKEVRQLITAASDGAIAATNFSRDFELQNK